MDIVAMRSFHWHSSKANRCLGDDKAEMYWYLRHPALVQALICSLMAMSLFWCFTFGKRRSITSVFVHVIGTGWRIILGTHF
mmetsp:Transcript_113714/g.321577  ORF Transcript_113714/g.321577 Transcript_113714/m.321577 type:complete len:82 (-) Transcript_113714:104-349(-)